MKIGIISDSHNNIINLDKAITILKEKNAEKIIHLGDNYTDIDEIGEGDIIRVPGVFSNIYQNHAVPNRKVEHFQGWRVLLTHTISSHDNDLPDDIKPEELIQNSEVDIVLYGHTHIPDIKKDGGIVFINPGHLKDEDKKGSVPTFGFLDLTENKIDIEIFDLKELSVYKKKTFSREKKCQY